MRSPRPSSGIPPILVAVALSLLVTPHVIAAQAGQGPPGLLSLGDYSALERSLERERPRDYVYRTIGSDDEPRMLRGLVVLRDVTGLREVGKDFVDDGRGNLVHQGRLPRRQGPAAAYSLTLFQDGSMALAVDLDADDVVDAAVSRGIDRFGFLRDAELDETDDCFERAMREHRNPIDAMAECLGLPSLGGRGAGRSGGIGSRFTRPDCGDAGFGGGRFGWVSAPDQRPGDTNKALEQLRNEMLRQADIAQITADAADDAGDADLAEAYDRLANAAEDAAIAAQRARDTAAGSLERDAEMGDVEAAYERVLEEFERVQEAEEKRQNPPGGGTTEPMPGEIPEGMDPRCDPVDTWTEIWTRYCAEDPYECILRLNDPFYAATDGQCWSETGPDDEEIVRCRGNDSMAECLAAGGSVEDCASETMNRCAVDTERRPEGCQGYAPAGRPVVEGAPRGAVELLDVVPLGGVIAAICREAGGAGFCGDPLPFR
jgi:hypothetical protein